MVATLQTGQMSRLAAVHMAALRLAVQRKAEAQQQVRIQRELEENFPKNALEWSRKYGMLRRADSKVLAFKDHERDYQVQFLQDESKRIIVNKSRQIGMSNIIAFIAAFEAVRGGTVIVVSKSLEQAVLFLRYVYTALDTSPHPKYKRRSLTGFEFVTGGEVLAQASSPGAGRGTPATLAILDEFAWQEYAKDTLTAIMPSLSTVDGRLIILSTPNGLGEPFSEQWSIATDPLTGEHWSVYELPWTVNPDWDQQWADETRADMGEREFAQEHGCDFLMSGLNVFSPDLIEKLWKLPPEGEPFFENPLPGHRYVSGFDIGRKRDAFVGFTFDVTSNPYRVVAYERSVGTSYPDMAARINWRHNHYNGMIPDSEDQRFWVRNPLFGNSMPTCKTAVESNGVGDPLIQFLEVPVTEFTTSPLTKKNLIDALLLLMQRGELVSPLIPQWKKELTVYLRQDEHLVQDTVMAAGFAAHVAGRPVARRVESFDSFQFYSG